MRIPVTSMVAAAHANNHQVAIKLLRTKERLACPLLVKMQHTTIALRDPDNDLKGTAALYIWPKGWAHLSIPWAGWVAVQPGQS